MKINLITFLTSLVIWIVFLFTIYQILDIIDPPISVDGHKIMPLKIAFESVIISFILTVIFFIFFRRYLKRKIN